jgi:UDP-3-O-[3-hydroxymyristoyl] N-acetylglucosamine deacetylase
VKNGRRTLASKVFTSGVTLHAGVTARLGLHPAAAGTGIVFRRSDLPAAAPIPAHWSNVAETRLGTVIRGADGADVAVIEHLMAAFAGACIDDCEITVDAGEVPILDGDALSFSRLIEGVGTAVQDGKTSAIRVARAVEVFGQGASARLCPAADASFFFEIDFASRIIGQQRFDFVFSPEEFRREIAPARTFGFLNEAEQLRAAGYARGADLTNTLVLDGDTLLNPGLRRFPDEFVRHKILDAIGDLKLAGASLIGRFEGRRSSHTLNNQLLRALFADPANYALALG